jgi:hypothetical protein
MGKSNISESLTEVHVLSIIKRISYSKISKAATEVFGYQSTSDKIAHEAFEVLTKTSEKNRSFFMGKSSRAILGGLFYLLGIRHNVVKTQKEVAVNLGTTDVTVRDSYRKWLEAFPDFFHDVISKFEECKEARCSLYNQVLFRSEESL